MSLVGNRFQWWFSFGFPFKTTGVPSKTGRVGACGEAQQRGSSDSWCIVSSTWGGRGICFSTALVMPKGHGAVDIVLLHDECSPMIDHGAVRTCNSSPPNRAITSRDLFAWKARASACPGFVEALRGFERPRAKTPRVPLKADAIGQAGWVSSVFFWGCEAGSRHRFGCEAVEPCCLVRK